MELNHIITLILVTAAAFFDLRSKRIPNTLTYSACALGLLLGVFSGGWPGLGNAALGFAAGFVPMFILFAGGTLGGGDVKLMAGVGALLGFPAALNAVIASILAGGFFAAVLLLWQGRLLGILKYAGSKLWSKVFTYYAPLPEPEANDAFPFGVAIALGTAMTIASMVTGVNSPANLFGW